MDIQKFWDAVLRQDADAIRPFFYPDARINWHCTNEQFTVEEFIRANCEYPGDWDGEIEKTVYAGNLIITATHVHSKDGAISCHATSFIKLREDKISQVDEYWADDEEAPKWRQNMNIGRKIK